MGGIAMFKGEQIIAMAGNNAALLPALAADSPREVWVNSAQISFNLTFDFGATLLFDSFYLGSTNAVGGDTWTIYSCTDLAGAGLVLRAAAAPIIMPGAKGRFSCISLLAAPVSTRYLRLNITRPAAAAPFEIGAFCAGLRFEHAYAWGAGRQPIDLSGVTQLIDGGFGIDEAAMKAAFKWKFIDLSDSEREQLWDFVIDRGARRPLVVVEDVYAAPLRASQLHYCKFTNLEAYERQDPASTVWALSAEEWL